VRNLREETETIDEGTFACAVVRVLMNLTGKFKECGLRLVEKEKEWIEYRVLFSSVAEKEDWIAKMKVLKVEFQSSGKGPPSFLWSCWAYSSSSSSSSFL
jgi:hypothetical protein